MEIVKPLPPAVAHDPAVQSSKLPTSTNKRQSLANNNGGEGREVKNIAPISTGSKAGVSDHIKIEDSSNQHEVQKKRKSSIK